MIILYKVEIKNWGARDCGTPQKWRMKMCTWKRKNRQKLVFPTVFPRNYDTPRDLIYMLYLDWYDAKFSRKSGNFQKQCVFPLFSRQIKKELRFYLNSLIFNVDQLGLEPRTSRLWVCCSNQLSYKSENRQVFLSDSAAKIVVYLLSCKRFCLEFVFTLGVLGIPPFLHASLLLENFSDCPKAGEWEYTK